MKLVRGGCYLTLSHLPFRVEEEGAGVDEAARVDDAFYLDTIVYSSAEGCRGR